MSDDITSRHRDIEPNHITPIATQSLYALLRIEELLARILAVHEAVKPAPARIEVPKGTELIDVDGKTKGKRK